MGQSLQAIDSKRHSLAEEAEVGLEARRGGRHKATLIIAKLQQIIVDPVAIFHGRDADKVVQLHDISVMQRRG